jgi:hypothetical protein
MTETVKRKRDEWIVRISFLALAIFFGYSFIFKISYDMRAQYWLSLDAKQTMALITKVHGQGVNYKYSVDGKEYSNESQRNWEHDVGAGQESMVFYSSSHPWLSSVTTPQFQPLGAIVLLIALIAEFLIVITAINPKSTLALNVLKETQPKPKT